MLTGLLVSDIALAAAAVIVSHDGRSESPFHLEFALKPVVVLWRVASAVTVAVFLFWLYAGLPLPDGWTNFVPRAIAGISLVVIIQVTARHDDESRLAVPLACL